MPRSLLLLALLLAACAPAPAVAPARPVTAPAAAAAPVKAVARLGLRDAGGRRLLADAGGDLAPWQAGDVAYVTLDVADGDTSVMALKLEGAAISAPVELYPLAAGRTYQVVGRAYREGAGGPEAIDAYAADPATCTTTFSTRGSGVTTLADPLRIQFAPRSFAGAGTTTLGILPGAVDDVDPVPGIEVGPLP